MTSWMGSQIEARSKYDSEMTERAYAELAASVSGYGAAPRIIVDDIAQTDGAAKACLAYIGVEAGEVPPNIVDFDERIDWLCRPTGTMRRNVRLEGDWWKKAFGAMVGHLDTGEAVPLLPHGIHGYHYLEPGTNRKVKVNAMTAWRIQSEAVLFYLPLPAKPLKTTDLVAFIARVFNRNDYFLVLVAAAAAALIGLALPWANQVAFSVVAPSGQARLILPIAALLLGVVVSTALINACRSLVMSRVSMKLDVVAEAATFARILALPTSFFKEYSSGNLGNRVSTVTMLAQQLADIVLGAALTALLSTVYIIQIGTFTPVLVLPALVIALVQAAFMVIATLLTMRYESETMEANAKLSGEVTALLNGVQKIKLAGPGYANYARPAYNRPALVRSLPAVVTLVGLLGTIVIYYLAGSNSVAIADYMAFSAAFGQVTASFVALAEMAGQFAQINPMLDMVAPILEATPEIAEGKPSVESLSGGIEVSGVSFRYGEDLPYVLNDLSFNIKPGEYVALVGRSGCGKSTIVRLLLGFEEPERGAVYFDQYDVQRVDLRSLRQHVGVVMQDGKLFMGDIANNITISTPSATLDDAWSAAELAGLADDIRKMPMGMQTLVTEGSGGVSGGQRQRIMIARAICGQRRVLIFDEATSALDNVTQKHVSDSLDSLKCTRVVVAHRLSTVKNCDRILVVDGGKIAEEGTYDELIAKNGLFAELVERQRLDKE